MYIIKNDLVFSSEFVDSVNCCANLKIGDPPKRLRCFSFF